MKFATFDIETTSLNGTYGRILCACWKFFDEKKPRTVHAFKHKDEPAALEKIYEFWNECDVVITWNGKLFDRKVTNLRMANRRTEIKCPYILEPKMHVDAMWTYRTNFRGCSAKLEHVSENLNTKTKKFHADAADWIKAADGNRISYDKIVKHCQQDVILTEEVFHILTPYIVRITR